jgi:hypothetical protein
MITIQHLEVQFDVEGDEEEQLFVAYFNKYIEAWSRRRDSQRQISDAMGKNRSLGDRDKPAAAR